MLQNFIDQSIFEEFKYKTENIDKLAKWAFERNCQRITEKYSNIDTTVKILNNLMGDFARKADKVQKNLLSMAKITECEMQKSYYEKRISQCMELSQKLRSEIQQRRQKVIESEVAANETQKKLIKIKTDNIKLVMQIQEIERMQKIKCEKKSRDIMRSTIRQKKQEQSKMILAKNPPCLDESLVQENSKLQHELATMIKQAKELGESVEQIFVLMRDRLRKNQTKSNGFGLAGSMYFKLSSDDKKKTQKAFPYRKKHDAKLLIYDVLKHKYNRVIKEQQKEKEEFNITLEQFMQYSALQIMGVIELKGGFEALRWKQGIIDDRWKQYSIDERSKPGIIDERLKQCAIDERQEAKRGPIDQEQ